MPVGAAPSNASGMSHLRGRNDDHWADAMSSFHEFHEPIAVETPLGPGRAILVERTPHDYLWTVALETRALVSFTQDRIRIGKSYTHDRGISDEEMRGIIARSGPETE